MNTVYYKNHDELSSLNTKWISPSIFTLIRSGARLKKQNLTEESFHKGHSLTFCFYLHSLMQLSFLILSDLISISAFTPAAVGSIDYFLVEHFMLVVTALSLFRCEFCHYFRTTHILSNRYWPRYEVRCSSCKSPYRKGTEQPSSDNVLTTVSHWIASTLWPQC